MELHRRPQKPPPPLFDERPKENEVFEGIDLLEEYSNRSTGNLIIKSSLFIEIRFILIAFKL